jgi:YD repeat-containing protein
MKISYDAEVDALSITFRDATVTTKHLAEGIAADYDSEGRLAGVEILDAQKRFGGRETMRHVELEGVGA